jgi:predicted xylose isomerase-like sugar epimerase
MRLSFSVLSIVLSVLIAAPNLQAQTHTANQAALDAVVQQHVASVDADRAAIQRVLEHSEVKAVAARAGIELRSVASAVSTMDAADLARVAAQAQQVDRALAGGASTIVISTTTIIIALLVIILIVALVD